MKFTTLYLTFFDEDVATEEKPFTSEYYVDYDEMKLNQELYSAINSKCEGREILNYVIEHEGYVIVINSQYMSLGKTFYIDLKINDINHSVSMHLAGGFSGTFQLKLGYGFNYSLIMNEDAVKNEQKKTTKGINKDTVLSKRPNRETIGF